jgi:ABC-type lipoprotein release transport system permease subunit
MGLLGGGGSGAGLQPSATSSTWERIFTEAPGAPARNLVVPWWLVAAAIVFAFIVSLVSGLYPAARAARLDPVQALRYE